MKLVDQLRHFWHNFQNNDCQSSSFGQVQNDIQRDDFENACMVDVTFEQVCLQEPIF